MPDPLVTVVTPSFNQAAFIRATIESVLGQDYPRIEYIIMDGGSTDSTARIAGEYAARLTFVSEPDRGQAHAINKGFQRAAGEIVAWINSDDVLLPGAVSAAVRAFEESPQTGAVYGEGFCIDRDGAVTMRFPFVEPFNLWRLTWVCDYILQQATFFRRAALSEVGWLDESLHWALDWDVLVRLGKRFGLTHIPVDMGCLREYAETKTGSGGQARFRELRRVLQRQTGALWAPGCWYYGLDTYDKIWSGSLRRAGAARLADLVFKLCRRKIDLTALHAQGLYPGRWAGRRLRWMLPRGTERVLVKGEIPAWACAGGRQVIRARSNGTPLDRRAFPAGPFEWEVDASRADSTDALTLEFESRYAAVAMADAAAPQGQRLSWRMISIDGL